MRDSDDLLVTDFDYELPQELIAQVPLVERDTSRMMVLDPAAHVITHGAIRDLAASLRRGDLLVANNTRVMPARIFTQKRDTGGRVELLLLHRDPSGEWTALAKPAKSLHVGTELFVSRDGGEVAGLTVTAKREDGEVGIVFREGADFDLDSIGAVPLPPYIRERLGDADRYQTVYASVPGSAAAPTAGLHITGRLRAELAQAGIEWAEVTLHIGLDTFRPVTVDRVADHKIHREWCSVPRETAAAIATARANGGRVVAVGTTSARTLEMWGQRCEGERELGFDGWADLFITPGYRWRVIDGLLTNFHLPRSTLLMMVSSLAGSEMIRNAYAAAIEARYRFFSFGDAMLILPGASGATPREAGSG